MSLYGQFLIFENGRALEKAKRVFIGENIARDEAWLRDTILDHPDIIPITDIDPSFGELVPICRELRTPVGPIDAVFMNRHGRMTIVECKLWKNPEARRKVVAQALDYLITHHSPPF